MKNLSDVGVFCYYDEVTFQYPYDSATRHRLADSREGQDYYIWHAERSNLQLVIDQMKKPVIEIGGPTDCGYFFLDGIAFNSKPTITNISSNPLPYAPDAKKLASMVDELVDGTRMPYDANSISVFLMAAISASSDWWVELSDEEKDKQSHIFDKENDVAGLEMGQFALGTLPLEKVSCSQRIHIYSEAYRALDKGGLLFCDGGVDDIVSLKHLGFKLIAYLQEQVQTENWFGISYEFVMQK
jgi:hypothetical protein